MSSQLSYKTTIIALASLASTACGTQADSAAERRALIALDQAYVEHWARNDAEGVMALFTETAVLLPHHGDTPRVGAQEIRDLWFPADAPVTTVTRFEHRVSDAEVEGDRGVLWGRFDLGFEDDGQHYAYEGNYLLVGAKGPDGAWRITHLTWNDPPPVITPAE